MVLLVAAIIFFIAIIFLILFILGLIFYFKRKANKLLNESGFAGVNLGDVIKEARIEDEELPKSLSSMDSIYLTNIMKDFPDLNINELKSKAEKIILDSYNSVEAKDSNGLKGKIKSFTDDMINDYKNSKVSFDKFKFHNTVVSKYSNNNGIATISLGSSFEYYLVVDGKSKKVQDRIRTEFIYVYDIDKVPNDLKVFGIHCPNCGSPIKSLGDKSCSYCGSVVKEVFGRVFTCDNIVKY